MVRESSGRRRGVFGAILFLTVLAVWTAAQTGPALAQAKKPNIVAIMSDDVGSINRGT